MTWIKDSAQRAAYAAAIVDFPDPRMKHPRSARGASPSRGRQQRPGKAGSALAWPVRRLFHASWVVRSTMENRDE